MGPTSPAQPMPATLVEPVAAQPPLPVDLIRAVAVFLVLLLHAAAEPVIAQLPPTEAWRWWAAHGYDSLARPCVPMFVMLSGALLLAPGKHEDLPSFFRKRLGRIGLPFLFWAAVHFAWRLWVQHEPLTLIGVARNLVEGSPYFHFWFIYMLLGLYLVTPGLRALLAAASTATLRYLLALWFIATAGVPLLARWTGVNLGSSGMLTLTGFVGYFVLGAYLRNHRPRLRTAALLWLLGLGWTVLATWRATVAANVRMITSAACMTVCTRSRLDGQGAAKVTGAHGPLAPWAPGDSPGLTLTHRGPAVERQRQCRRFTDQVWTSGGGD